MTNFIPDNFFLADICFTSGLPIVAPEKWRDVELVKGYLASFALIGKGILLTSPRGPCGDKGITAFLEARESFLKEMGVWDKPYIEIKDYSGVPLRIPKKAKNEFTKYMIQEVQRENVKGFFPFDTSLAVKLTYNLGAKLVKGDMNVHVYNDYEAAVKNALSVLGGESLTQENLGNIEGKPVGTITLGSDYVAQFKLIGHDILFNDAKGELLGEYVEGFFDGMEKILIETRIMERGEYYRIMDWEELTPTRWKVRKIYTETSREFEKKIKCKCIVVINATPFMRGILSLSQKFVSTSIRVADSLDEAIRIVNEERNRNSESLRRVKPGLFSRFKAKKRYTREEVENMNFDLLDYIGSVDWTEEGVQEYSCDKDNPFENIYEAVAVIKEDYDNLASEKEQMYLQVVQASKMASLGVLGAGVAHELNNPLAAVLGFAQILRTTTSDTKTLEAARKIEKASLRMKVIVSHLRDFSRESKRNDWRKISIFKPIEDSLVILGTQLESNDIEINIERDEEVPEMWGDPVQLESVFQNLIVNSKDAFLGKNVERKQINIVVEPQNRGLLVRYRDNARGMDEETKKKIFDPFYTTKEIGAGTGLGMSVTHGIISKHMGWITVDSTEGEGTEFKIFLPYDRRSKPRDGL